MEIFIRPNFKNQWERDILLGKVGLSHARERLHQMLSLDQIWFLMQQWWTFPWGEYPNLNANCISFFAFLLKDFPQSHRILVNLSKNEAQTQERVNTSRSHPQLWRTRARAQFWGLWPCHWEILEKQQTQGHTLILFFLFSVSLSYLSHSGFLAWLPK